MNLSDKCGTVYGYSLHRRKHKEEPCDKCRNALRDYWKLQRVIRNKQINDLRKSWRERTPNARRDRMHRANAAGGELGYYSDQDVLNLYGTDCHICNEPIDLNAQRQCGKEGWERALHIDHVIPLSKGGADTLENVKPSHGYCNIVKWATIK
jgi:5-methylcytosine-specific restriction endonuclease McrA